MRTIFILFFLFIVPLAEACSPILPKLVPPDDPMGEWKEVPLLTDRERFLSKLNSSSQIAVVNLYADFHYQTEPYNAQTEFGVLYGWGKSLPRDVKYVRQSSSCGKPEKYREGMLYVVLPFDGGFSAWLFSELKDQVELLGEPDYRHTENGIKFKQAHNQ